MITPVFVTILEVVLMTTIHEHKQVPKLVQTFKDAHDVRSNYFSESS